MVELELGVIGEGIKTVKVLQQKEAAEEAASLANALSKKNIGVGLHHDSDFFMVSAERPRASWQDATNWVQVTWQA